MKLLLIGAGAVVGAIVSFVVFLRTPMRPVRHADNGYAVDEDAD